MASGPGMPVTAPGGKPDRRHRYRWIWWLAGGCSISIILATAFLALLSAYAISGVVHCVPADFPRYPGAIWSGSGFGGIGCSETDTTLDGSSHIVDFYRSRFDGEKWTATATYRSVARIDFKHVGGARITCSVWVVDRTFFRAICLDFYKSAVTGAAMPRAQAQSMPIAARSTRDVCSGNPPQPA